VQKIFISHSSQDKALARRLFGDLKTMGYNPWLDEMEIQVGECIVSKIDDGIRDSRLLIILLSKNSVNSDWVEKEWQTKYWDEINSGKVQVLPVLVEDCAIPKLLLTKKYADFREGYTVGFSHLLEAIKNSDLMEQKPVSYLQEMKQENSNREFYWHRGIQEYFGLQLNLIFLQFEKDSVFFKESVIDDLTNLEITNYIIFETFSEWDVLIRFWSPPESATMLANKLEHNIDVKDINHISVKDLEHIYDGEYNYPSTEEIRDIIDEMGLKALLDLKKNGENSKYFDGALASGLLLKDTISFDPNKIQFYVIIKSLQKLGNAIISYIVKEMRESCEDIKSKTAYITTGTSTRAVLKGQVSDYYAIDEFVRKVTAILVDNEVKATTLTIFVANRNIQIKNQFDFIQAEENIVKKGFEQIIHSSPEPVAVSLGEKFNLLAKYHSAIDIIRVDSEDIIQTLLKAKLFNNIQYIKNIKDYFPEFEQSLRDNLPKVIMKIYEGKKWQDNLDNLKEQQGVKKSEKASHLVIGDLSKIYKQIVFDGNIIKLTAKSKKNFTSVMDNIPVFRNKLAHNSATLDGWDELFDFFVKFLPIRNEFDAFFKKLK